MTYSTFYIKNETNTRLSTRPTSQYSSWNLNCQDLKRDFNTMVKCQGHHHMTTKVTKRRKGCQTNQFDNLKKGNSSDSCQQSNTKMKRKGTIDHSNPRKKKKLRPFNYIKWTISLWSNHNFNYYSHYESPYKIYVKTLLHFTELNDYDY